METGLAGTGHKNNWRVDLDEIIGRRLYRLTITSPRYWIQIGGLPLDRVSSFQLFLSGPQRDESFSLQDAFGGRVEVSSKEEKPVLRISQADSEFGSNLLEITLEPEDRPALAIALAEAVSEAVS